jgi:hypothetical protein
MMKLGSPMKLEIKPNTEKTEFRFLLTFPEPQQPVEFVLDDAGTMMMMAGLQRLQVIHKIAIPRDARPSRKPKLRVVTPDG